MLSEIWPSASATVSRRTFREARTVKRLFCCPDPTYPEAAAAPCTMINRPLSASVSSITSSSMASSSSSRWMRLRSFSLNENSRRTPASSEETCLLAEVSDGGVPSAREATKFSRNMEKTISVAPIVKTIPMNKPRAALPLSVYGDIRVALDLFENEIPADENDLYMVLGNGGCRDRNVVIQRSPDGRDRLVYVVELGGARGTQDPQCRHRGQHSACLFEPTAPSANEVSLRAPATARCSLQQAGNHGAPDTVGQRAYC